MECKDAAAAVVADAGSQDGATFLITQSFFPGQRTQKLRLPDPEEMRRLLDAIS